MKFSDGARPLTGISCTLPWSASTEQGNVLDLLRGLRAAKNQLVKTEEERAGRVATAWMKDVPDANKPENWVNADWNP